jgi:hypothetical protein
MPVGVRFNDYLSQVGATFAAQGDCEIAAVNGKLTRVGGELRFQDGSADVPVQLDARLQVENAAKLPNNGEWYPSARLQGELRKVDGRTVLYVHQIEDFGGAKQVPQQRPAPRLVTSPSAYPMSPGVHVYEVSSRGWWR